MTLAYPSVVHDKKHLSKLAFHADTNADQKVRSLIQAMPNGIVLLDSWGYVREANQEALRLLGKPLIGMLWRTIIARSFRPQADDGHEVSLHSGKRVKLEISSLTHEPGQLIVLTDLSETRALLDRISHLKRLTDMGRMTASLAHQIRTPLSAAMLYAEHLTRSDLEIEQQVRFATQIQNLLGDLEQQVNDMLLYAKSGEQQVIQPIPLIKLIEEVRQGVELAAQRAEVVLHFPNKLPEKLFLGNDSALVGALQNILMNAIEASTKNGQVTLSFQATDKGAWLRIEDEGQGIAEQDIPHIFTPFFTRKSQGTGLGLAVVRTVIRAHQGSIHVQSTKGQGTRFEIFLPWYIKEELQADGVDELNKEEKASEKV